MAQSTRFESGVKGKKILVKGLTDPESISIVGWADRKSLAKFAEDVRCKVEGSTDWISPAEMMRLVCPKGEVVWSEHTRCGGYRPMITFPGMVVKKLSSRHIRDKEGELLSGAVLEIMRTTQAMNLAYVSGDELTVIAGSSKGWLEPYHSKYGLEVTYSPKLDKRLKDLGRLFPMVAEFQPGDIDVEWLEEDQESLVDGIGAISTELFEVLLESIKVEDYDREKATYLKEDGTVDKILTPKEWSKREEVRVNRQKARVRKSRMFNGRICVPKGTPGAEKGGVLKGNWMVCDLPGTTSIRVHRTNLKPELHGWNRWIVGMEAQPMVPHVRTSVQMMTSLPQLFPIREVMEWAVQEIRRVSWYITSPEREGWLDDMDTIAELHRKLALEGKGDSESLNARWQALEFVEMGYSLKNSPRLAERLFESHTRTMISSLGGKVRIKVPVPCAWDCQIISETAFLKLTGEEVDVRDGELRFISEFGLAVVSDLNWLEMIQNHGGCDMDDHFNLFYRLIDGKRKIVVMRNPSEVRNWSCFDYVEGDEFPTNWDFQWVRQNGEQVIKRLPHIEFPPADLTGALAPVTQSEVTFEMPPKGEPRKEVGYTKEGMSHAIQRWLHGGNPGGAVNLCILWAMHFPAEDRPYLRYPLEKIIDANVQEDDLQVLVHMETERVLLRKAFIDKARAEGITVDRRIWESMRLGKADIQLGEGWPTRLWNFIETRKKEAGISTDPRSVTSWAQREHEVPEVLLTRYSNIAEEEQKFLLKVLNWFRLEAFNQLKEEREGNFTEKEKEVRRNKLFQDCLDAVGKENVGQFALLVHTKRTKTTGKISDGVLMNNIWWPSYRDALKA